MDVNVPDVEPKFPWQHGVIDHKKLGDLDGHK